MRRGGGLWENLIKREIFRIPINVHNIIVTTHVRSHTVSILEGLAILEGRLTAVWLRAVL